MEFIVIKRDLKTEKPASPHAVAPCHRVVTMLACPGCPALQRLRGVLSGGRQRKRPRWPPGPRVSQLGSPPELSAGATRPSAGLQPPGTTVPRQHPALCLQLKGGMGTGKSPKGYLFATICECSCGNARFGKGGCACPAGEGVGWSRGHGQSLKKRSLR